MIYAEEGQSLGVKTVSTKLSREEFTRFQYHCKSNKEIANKFLKRLILTEIDNPEPIRIAGKSKFEYNVQKDNFKWEIILDDDSHIVIDENLPANTIEQLLESLMTALDKRKSTIKKSTKESVSIPNKLVVKKK